MLGRSSGVGTLFWVGGVENNENSESQEEEEYRVVVVERVMATKQFLIFSSCVLWLIKVRVDTDISISIRGYEHPKCEPSQLLIDLSRKQNYVQHTLREKRKQEANMKHEGISKRFLSLFADESFESLASFVSLCRELYKKRGLHITQCITF